MNFFKNYKRKKEIEHDCENYFKNMIIKNLSDFNRYSEYLNNDKRINIFRRVCIFFGILIVAGLLIIIYRIFM
jgi:hypothetical protein